MSLGGLFKEMGDTKDGIQKYKMSLKYLEPESKKVLKE